MAWGVTDMKILALYKLYPSLPLPGTYIAVEGYCPLLV